MLAGHRRPVYNPEKRQTGRRFFPLGETGGERSIAHGANL
jgi:hypothetical protein